MNFNTFAIEYIRRKSNILLTTVLLEYYYLNLELDQTQINSLPPAFGNKIQIIHIKRCYSTIVNIMCEYHKVIYGKWLTTDYIRINNKWTNCFVCDLWENIEKTKLSPLELFKECDNWDSLFELIERNPIQYKLMIESIKHFSVLCNWILKQNIDMDDECRNIIHFIIKWTNSLEFKSLEVSSTCLNNKNINEFFECL
jgi:hypothetical protein